MPDIFFNLTLVNDLVWIADSPTGVGQYDFAFHQFFACKHPYRRDAVVRAVARMGAAPDYADRHQQMRAAGVELIHSPAEYDRTSRLPVWFPLIEDLTPRSIWFDRRPSAAEIGAAFKWPVFVKGERQTSRHRRALSILDGPDAFERAMDAWVEDDILHWQQIVCREFIPLRLVGEQSANTLPRAFEFRSFWWRVAGKYVCVGIGPYWRDEHYDFADRERETALAIAAEAARRIDVQFLVVDVAQTTEGRWIVIEVNDGQDSGYAGISPFLLWQRVLEAERSKSAFTT